MTKYFNLNAAGSSIKCKLCANDPRAVRNLVVYGHGFGGHKDNHAAERFAETLLSKRKDAALLTFDLPAHGDDVKKRLTLGDCDAYLREVLAYAQTELHPAAVFGYGTSFGGFLFLKYLAEHGNPFRRLALRCPAVDIYESLTTKILTPKDAEALRKGRDAELGFDRKVRVNQAFFDELRTVDLFAHDYLDYADDLLILQGTADEIVSYDAVSRFADQNCIELIPFDRADHRFHDPAKMGAAIAEIMKFFAPAFQ
jgi:alpha-beta hydrolase superfamily lysophospholipase